MVSALIMTWPSKLGNGETNTRISSDEQGMYLDSRQLIASRFMITTFLLSLVVLLAGLSKAKAVAGQAKLMPILLPHSALKLEQYFYWSSWILIQPIMILVTSRFPEKYDKQNFWLVWNEPNWQFGLFSSSRWINHSMMISAEGGIILTPDGQLERWTNSTIVTRPVLR